MDRLVTAVLATHLQSQARPLLMVVAAVAVDMKIRVLQLLTQARAAQAVAVLVDLVTRYKALLALTD